MRPLLVLVACLVLSVAAACGSDDDSLATGDDGSGASVEGDYVAVDITEDGEPRPLVDGTELTLRLMDGQLGASAGCNSIGGSYEIVVGELRVDALSMTEMGCDPPRHEQDEWLTDLLSSGPSVEPVDDGLVLRSGATVVELRDRSVVHPNVELVGTTWEVTGFISGTGPDAAVSSVAGLDARVVFGEDGTVTGSDGCDRFTIGEADEERGYVIDGDTIVFEAQLVGESSQCPILDDRPEAVRAVLDGTVTWEIESNRLTLTADDGSGVTFRAAEG